MNREELKKQIVINFEKDEITEKERLINVMQCIDAHIEQLSIPLVSQQREQLLGFLKYLESLEVLKHTETWQLKTYVDNYLKDK